MARNIISSSMAKNVRPAVQRIKQNKDIRASFNKIGKEYNVVYNKEYNALQVKLKLHAIENRVQLMRPIF